MPIKMRIDVERRRAVGRVVGDFTSEEIVEAIRYCGEHPEFRRGFDVLTDHTAIGTPLSKAQVEVIASLLIELAGSLGGARWAVVTTKAASRGMINMLSVYAEEASVDVRVFGSMSEAEAWLAPARAD